MKTILSLILCLSGHAFEYYQTQDIPPKPIKWSTPSFRFCVVKGANNDRIKSAVESVAKWSKHSSAIECTYSTYKPQVRIYFQSFPKEIKSLYAFAMPMYSKDGKSIIATDIFVNTRFTWSYGGHGKTLDLNHTLPHEFGHVFGGAHSVDRRSLMASPGSESVTDLQADDINLIQFLYGK